MWAWEILSCESGYDLPHISLQLSSCSAKPCNRKWNGWDPACETAYPTQKCFSISHHCLQIFYLVDKAPPGKWEGGVGYLTEELAKEKLPPPGDDTLILVCGPPPMMKAISGDKAPDKSQGNTFPPVLDCDHMTS